jgi:predicted ATPase
MHLLRLKVQELRNLKNIEITFDESGEDFDGEKLHFNSHAIIGANGSGKSNLLEAIVSIFRDIDLNNAASLDYELDYKIRDYEKVEHLIQLKGQDGKRPTVVIDGKESSQKDLLDNPNTFLPANIFVYYSGRNERLEQLFQTHMHRYNKMMRMSDEEQVPASLLVNFSGTDPASVEAFNKRLRNFEERKKKLGEDQLRRLFYCRGAHTQLVLLACLLSPDEVFARILRDLGIVELDSALFVLKQPYHLRSRVDEDDVKLGDPRFWFARGTVVSQFLDKLWNNAIAPIDDHVDKQIDFRGRTEKQEQLYLFVPDKTALENLGAEVGDSNMFFRYAEGAYIADLIEEIRITVKHKDAEGNIKFSHLSEGELQLLTVLGLMRITAQDNCLFLLDEPDTHLNPIWKLRYFDEIEEIIRSKADQTVVGDSQIIITTHDPIMIAGLRREQVHIFRAETGGIGVSQPTEHPQGMGVSGLLKSDMFGLPSILDSRTKELLARRNDLLAIRAKRKLSAPEEWTLKKLINHLDDLGFAREYRDPDYQFYIEKIHEARSKPMDQLFTQREREDFEKLAERIVTAIVKKERTQEMSALARELHTELKK